MRSRLAVVALLTALVIATTSGCLPRPSPSATPTPGFTSAEQAFAAAEKTYRAYVDALNHVDLSDPKTFEPVYAWTTGTALEGEKKSLTAMHSKGWMVSGESKLLSFVPYSATSGNPLSTGTVACMDVSQVGVVDRTGLSQVSSKRPPRYALEIRFSAATASPTGLLIASSKAIEDSNCSG